jgi:L-gulonate 5-dehydrogenase
MKIGIVEKPGVLKITDRDVPKVVNPDDVLIKVKRVGICGSDVHIFHGTNPFAVYPRVWGHEFVGEVLETGTEVPVVKTELKKGMHVVVEPIISCGKCYACRQGRRNACQTLKVMGVHIDGGCQEAIVVPAANVHMLSDSVPWDEAVLIEPFTIGAQACYRGNVQPGDFVLVMGAGTIGLTVLQMAKLAGATVIITDIFQDKLAYAKSRGADYTINVKEADLFEKVKEITGGMGPNVTIDAVCIKESFEQAVEITSVAGRIVELSMSGTASEIAPVHIMRKELSIYGTRHQTRRFPVVIDYLNQGKLPLKGFMTKIYPIAQMAEAFDYVDKNNATVRKVAISFD